MIRAWVIAAVTLLSANAWAQSGEPAPEPPPSDPAAAVPAELVSDPPPESTPAIPTDPMELAAFALANAREPGQCRFAFSRLTTTAAQVAWSDADADVVARFDPRLPIGERWQLLRASSQERAIRRSMEREDRKGLASDLIMLLAEGEWTFEDLALTAEHADRYVYAYTPRTVPGRAIDETGIAIIEQLVGELEVSRETGRMLSSTLREPPAEAVRSLGIVRVHRALLRNSYIPGANGFQLAEGGSQMLSMSALLTRTELTTVFRYQEVEPICDPAEVARIAETEAAVAAARDN